MDDTQLLRLLNEIRDDISRAENKASIALAASSLVAGSVLGEMIDRYNDVMVVTKVLLIGTLASLLVGLVSLGLALLPNIVANKGGPEMLAFFGHVTASGTMEEFERRAAVEYDERTRLLNQIWTLSFLTTKKYRHIRRAFEALAVAVALGVSSMAVEGLFG